MEDRNPEISVATKAFLRRRTAGLAPERYAKSELVVPDGFSDRYMGKDYAGTHHTELFSCGMEAITHGRFGGLTGRPSIFLPAPVASASPTEPSPQKPTPSTWPSSLDCWPQPTNASREPGDKKAPGLG